MRSSTAAPTRLPGSSLVVVLLAGSLLLGPSPASAAGEPDPAGVWPLSPARVAERFRAPATPWGPGHRGVDLLGRVGQVVGAALAGRVRYAGALFGRGVVVVEHGGTRTTYEPVAPAVRTGDVLTAGQPLGSLTSDRSHCLPAACLHWGWVRDADGTYLDPLRLVDAGPVRLLPLWREEPTGAAAPASPYATWSPPLQLLRFPPGA